MYVSGGSQPRKEEGASHLARHGRNAEAFPKKRSPPNGRLLSYLYSHSIAPA